MTDIDRGILPLRNEIQRSVLRGDINFHGDINWIICQLIDTRSPHSKIFNFIPIKCTNPCGSNVERSSTNQTLYNQYFYTPFVSASNFPGISNKDIVENPFIDFPTQTYIHNVHIPNLVPTANSRSRRRTPAKPTQIDNKSILLLNNFSNHQINKNLSGTWKINKDDCEVQKDPQTYC